MCKNRRGSAVFEILRPAHLAPATIPLDHICTILMFKVIINRIDFWHLKGFPVSAHLANLHSCLLK